MSTVIYTYPHEKTTMTDFHTYSPLILKRHVNYSSITDNVICECIFCYTTHTSCHDQAEIEYVHNIVPVIMQRQACMYTNVLMNNDFTRYKGAIHTRKVIKVMKGTIKHQSVRGWFKMKSFKNKSFFFYLRYLCNSFISTCDRLENE